MSLSNHRKSDVKDAQWIAECLQKELIRGSYVPDEELQQMRQYSRRYDYLTKQIVRVEQRTVIEPVEM